MSGVILCCVVVGWDSGWLVMLFVVLEVCCGFSFLFVEVYFNVVGGYCLVDLVVDFVVVVVLILGFGDWLFV